MIEREQLETGIATLKAKIDPLSTPLEIVQAFDLGLIEQGLLVKDDYPTYEVLCYENPQSITDEKFSNTIVIDIRLQWLIKGEGSLLSALSVDSHYAQIHLYLYFKPMQKMTPAKLREVEFTPKSDLEEFLSSSRSFFFTLFDSYPTQTKNYVGKAISYLETY